METLNGNEPLSISNTQNQDTYEIADLALFYLHAKIHGWDKSDAEKENPENRDFFLS